MKLFMALGFFFSARLEAQLNYSAPKLDSLKVRLDEIFSNKLFTQAHAGFCVQSMRTGKTLYERNADDLLSTASCLKLVTTAAALDRWGTQYQFKTGFYTDGKIAQGIVDGNLYIKGYGDPYFISEILERTVYHLKASGITEIRGGIIADDSYLQDTPNAETNDRAYSAIGGALGFNFNSVGIFVKPGKRVGDTAVVFTEPVLDWFKIKNGTLTTDSTKSLSVTNFTVHADYSGEHMTIAVYGGIPITEDEIVIYKRINEPAKYVAAVIKHMFELYGIKITGKISTGITPKNFKIVSEPGSFELSHIVAGTNKYSNNYVAGQLLMIMGAQEFGEPGTDEKGIRAIKPFLKKAGIRDNEIIMVDGSGLDGRNQMTPRALVRLLEYMYHDFQNGPEYVSSLSIAGVDGTEKKRFRKNGGPVKTSRLKIGYLWDVSTLSGYVETKNKDVLAFSILTNGFPKEYYEAVKQLEDKICMALADL